MTSLHRTMNCTNVGVSYAWHHLDSDANNIFFMKYGSCF